MSLALGSTIGSYQIVSRLGEVLASLNHPHIAQIYGFEESVGTS